MSKKRLRRDLPEYYVTKVEVCPNCQGATKTDNPLYAEFNLYLDDFNRTGTAPTQEEEDAWWASRGYPDGDWPQEEFPCEDCLRTGYVESQIPLRQALHEVAQQTAAIAACPADIGNADCVCGYHKEAGHGK